MSASIREAALLVARKNAKSAIVAVLMLGYLVGPLHRPGWRAAVCSVTKEKAAELKRQAQEVAEASGLRGLRFLRSPAPGRVEADGADLQVLAADKVVGHASGYDLVVVDETGLLAERDRALLNGLRSSVSARDGRLLHISIIGGAPFTRELIDSTDPSVHVEVYQAPAGCRLDDEAAWQAANPGLGTIKSRSYMQDRARWAMANGADAADFRAHDLNQVLRPSVELLVDPEQWEACEREAQLSGPCYWGVDAGGAASMSAVAGYWPETGALLARAAFPCEPPLAERGLGDSVGALYEQLAETGELLTLGQRTADVAELIRRCAADWGAPVAVAGDRYRESEILDALDSAGLPPSDWEPRGQGWRDGSEDVRGWRAGVLDRRIAAPESALLRYALSGAVVTTDGSNNAKLARGGEAGRRSRHRDDAAAAAVLAVALGRRRERALQAREPVQQQREWIVFPGAGVA